MKFKIDPILLALLSAIILCGLIILYSAGYDPEHSVKIFTWLPIEIHSKYFIRQLQNLIIGMIPGVIVFFLGTKRIAKMAIPLYLLSAILLVVVIVAGHSAKGSSRWIPIGPLKFQPSELAKVSAIIFFSWYLATFKDLHKLAGWRELFKLVMIMIIPWVLILIQPDLGTALAFGGVVAGMYLLAGVKPKILLLTFVLFLSSLPIAWNFVLKPYQQNRVLTLFNPESDPLGTGYHTIQSKIAIGSGGLFGKGFLKGSQTQLQFLPEHTTDFIFSVVAEEWGFVGCCLILALYFALILRLLYLATRTKHLFQTYFCFGFACYLIFHVFVNVGMVIGILPVVGIPLPLLSYGGTAMMTIMILSGIALSISYDSRRL